MSVKKYFSRKRQERFRELFKLNEDVKFKVKRKFVEVTTGYNKLKVFTDNQEGMEDFFGTKIHSIKKFERRYRCDLVRFYTEPFKLYRISRFINPKYTKTYGAYSYEGKEIVHDQQEFSSVLFVGIPGSGKTEAMKAQMEYASQANKAIKRRVKKIIITPKTNDFKGYVGSDDVLMEVKTLEDYEKLIKLIREATEHTMRAINRNEISDVFYILLLDEILFYLSSGKELSKELAGVKLELAGLVENFARIVARAGRQLLLAGTQDPSVGSCLVKSKFFTLKFISRVETTAQANVFNFGAELLDEGLRKGIFYNSVTREKVRFPIVEIGMEVDSEDSSND